MSREELSRHEREVRANRMIVMAMAGIAVLLIAILAFGYWRETVARPGEAVATVAGHDIALDSYARRLDFQRKLTEQQIQYMQVQLQANSSASSSQGGADSIANLFRQQIQQLQFSLMLLPDQTLDQMIEDQLVRQEAGRRGISVAADEIDGEIKKNFGDQPTPVPVPAPTSAAGRATAQPSATPTPGSSPTPLPTADAQARLNSFLLAYGISGADYRGVVESQLLYQKLQKAMGADAPTKEEQIHARHILLDSEDKAKEVLDKLKSGTSFEDLAKAESKDASNKDKGGDLGWFPKGKMVAEFDTAAFQLEPHKFSDPVKTQFGYHIIEVLEKDPNHPLDDQTLTSRKDSMITSWLDTARTGPDIKRNLTDAQKQWAFQKINWRPSP